MEPKDEGKKKSKKVTPPKVRMIQANSLEEALKMLGEELKKAMKASPATAKPRVPKGERPKLPEAEQAELNKTWDEYAKEVREKMADGKMDGAELCLLGMTIDATAEDAKTDYITKSMYRLAIEIVEKLDAVPVPEGMDVPKEVLEAKAASAKEAAAEYRKRIDELEAPAIAEAEAKEKAHVAEEAKGAFANVSMSDILNAPKADGLPDF